MARKKSEMSKTDVKQTGQAAAAQEKMEKADAVHEELKAAVAKGSVLFGSRSVMKALKLKNPKMIFVASNCIENVKNDISASAKISGVKVENFAGTGKQLGIFCGKPFAVASLAVLEEHKKK